MKQDHQLRTLASASCMLGAVLLGYTFLHSLPQLINALHSPSINYKSLTYQIVVLCKTTDDELSVAVCCVSMAAPVNSCDMLAQSMEIRLVRIRVACLFLPVVTLYT